MTSDELLNGIFGVFYNP